LRALGDKQLQKLLKRHVSKTVDIIVEKGNFGRSQSFVPVHFEGDMKPGTLAQLYAGEIKNDKLFGRLQPQNA